MSDNLHQDKPKDTASEHLSVQTRLALKGLGSALNKIEALHALCGRAADALEAENRLLQEPRIAAVIKELRAQAQ